MYYHAYVLRLAVSQSRQPAIVSVFLIICLLIVVFFVPGDVFVSLFVIRVGKERSNQVEDRGRTSDSNFLW